MKLEDGKLIEEKKDFEFIIGDEAVIPGIEKCVTSMKLGEKCLTKIKPKNGYGEKGNEQLGIPPNATLLVEIELVQHEKQKQTWEMSSDEKIEFAEKLKKDGNDFYVKKNYKLALKRYKKAADIFPRDLYQFNDDQKKQIEKLKTILYANIAAVHLARKNAKKTLEYANKASNLLYSNSMYRL